MIRNWQLATALAIAISAGGTSGSVQAGGFGGFGGFSGGGGGRSHSGGSHHHSGHNHSSRPSGGSNNGGSRIMQSGGNVIRSGNLGGINLGNSAKTMPKNTGIVPPVFKTGGSNNTGGGIKLPGVGNVGGNSSNKGPSSSNIGSNILKNISGNNGNSGNKGPSIQSQVLNGLGIRVGSGNGPGAGKGPGSGSGNGNGHGHHNHDHHNHHGHHHNHSGHHGHNHHGHHHHCPPLVFTLPACNPTYCPPCPPIYYPQPVPVPVPVPMPTAEPFPVPAPVPMGEPMPIPTFDPTVDPSIAPGPVAPAGGPIAQDPNQVAPISAEAPVAAANPAEAQSAGPQGTEVVSKDVPLPQIPVGATLTLNGKDLSETQGQVVLQLGEIALPATIKEWKNDAVVCTLPVLGLTKASKATLHVLKADGKTASTMNVELVTTLPTSVEAAPAGPSSSTALDASKYEQ